MAEQARSGVEIRDFAGVINNADRIDLPPGAADEQKNICSIKAGEMVSRGGWKQVTFEDG